LLIEYCSLQAPDYCGRHIVYREVGKTNLFNPGPKIELCDGRLEIDNTGAVNVIRPFVLRRKTWLFNASVKDVKSSANLYSLIETAKVNGLEPYACLLRIPVNVNTDSGECNTVYSFR
jgi:hypothetical protein